MFGKCGHIKLHFITFAGVRTVVFLVLAFAPYLYSLSLQYPLKILTAFSLPIANNKSSGQLQRCAMLYIHVRAPNYVINDAKGYLRNFYVCGGKVTGSDTHVLVYGEREHQMSQRGCILCAHKKGALILIYIRDTFLGTNVTPQCLDQFMESILIRLIYLMVIVLD